MKLLEKLKADGISLSKSSVSLRIIFNIAGFFLSLVPSFIILYVTDNWIECKKNISVETIACSLLLCVLVRLFIFYYVNYNGQKFSDNAAESYRKTLSSKILDCEISEYNKINKSSILNIINDVSAVYTICDYIVFIPANIIKIVSVVIILWYRVSYKIALIAVSLIPLYFVSNLFFKSELEKKADEERSLGDKWIQEIDILLNGKASINLNRASSYMKNRQNRFITDYFLARRKQHFLLIITQEIPKLITTIAPILVLMIGGNLVIKEKVTLGELLFALQVVNYIFDPLSDIAILHAQMMSQRIRLLKSREFLSLPDNKIYSQSTLLNDSKNILIENVRINSPDGKFLFHISHFETENGLILVKGGNGSGKTTFLNYISGMIPLHLSEFGDSGCFHIPKWSNGVGYLFYPNYVFPDTVMENVLCGTNCSEDFYLELQRILHMPEQRKLIRTKPENLSLGEKQKIYLARLFSKEYTCYLLDEPGSNLDEQTEENLIAYINKIKRNHTIIVITHNDKYDSYADKIYQIIDSELRKLEK